MSNYKQVFSKSVRFVRSTRKIHKYHFMPCQFEFLEARLALQVGSELKNREKKEDRLTILMKIMQSFYSVKHGLSNIPSNIQLLIANIYFSNKRFSFDQSQNSIKKAILADCLKLIKQNKLFEGINDVIFDDPYLTEQKGSAFVFNHLCQTQK